MALSTDSRGLKDLSVSVRANFMNAYQAAEGYQPFAPRIAAMTESKSRKTKFPMPVDSASIRKHIGPRVINLVKATDQDLPNDPYELTYGIDRDDLEDEDESETAVKTALTTIRKAARKYRFLPDRLLVEVLSTNAKSVVDGQPLFGDHKRDPTDQGSATFSNAKTARPLTAANLFTTQSEMASYLAPDGDPINLNPNIVLIPPALLKTALEITQAPLVPNTAGTATQTNVLVGMGWVVMVMPQLAALSNTTYYVLDASDPDDRGLVFVERKKVEIVEKFNPDDPAALSLNQYQWFSRWRGAAGGGNPMKITRCVAA